MLHTLRIQNLAIIDEAEIRFQDGLNILSGETGAGKSIVIQAISLILGARANTDLVRKGTKEAIVEGHFDLADMPTYQERLGKLGFGSSESELLIKRVIHSSGRHRIYVNGELATLVLLQNLCDGLVDLCAQHEHQSLLKSATQLELLDRYGGLERDAIQVNALFSHVRSLRNELKALSGSLDERTKKVDFVRFQLSELDEAGLSEGEDERLQDEKALLHSTEKRVTIAQNLREIFSSDSGGVIRSLERALHELGELSRFDESLKSQTGTIEKSLSLLADVDLEINRYAESIEVDPRRLNEVEERLSKIAKLKRKYGSSVAEMLQSTQSLRKELESLEQFEERLANLDSELRKSNVELLKEGRRLFEKRKKAAGLLSDSVSGELKDLNMAEAAFEAPIEFEGETSEWSPTSGGSVLGYRVRTNRGESFKALGKVASGGELSRLMLSIRRVIADRGGIGVYLFDEIDAGIGGQTAFEVGKKLKSVSDYNQVICITHLPQIACFANHHLNVSKKAVKGRTLTTVLELDPKGKKEELARMLGGPKLTQSSLKNAAELIASAESV